MCSHALQADIEAGQQDLYQACRQSLAHGVLLLMHYLAPLVPWQDAAVDPGQAAAIRPWLQGLLQLLEQATELVLQPLSKPQESNIGKHAYLLPPSCPPSTPSHLPGNLLVPPCSWLMPRRSWGHEISQTSLLRSLLSCSVSACQETEQKQSQAEQKNKKGRKESREVVAFLSSASYCNHCEPNLHNRVT